MLYIKYGVLKDDKGGFVQKRIRFDLIVDDSEFFSMWIALLKDKIKKKTKENKPIMIELVFYG